MKLPYRITGEKNLPDSELEIEAEISYEALTEHRKTVLKKISAEISVPGFRVGRVPENIVVQKVGDLHILEEAAYTAIEEALPLILAEKKLSIVGEPVVSITKLAADNPLGFKITFALLPEVALPDYKKIASAENAKKPAELVVSEKEVGDFIENFRKSYAREAAPAAGAASRTLPEITDDFVKKLGHFKDVADFRLKIKENLALEKERKQREKNRLVISEKILEKTKTAVPKVLVESELRKMSARLRDDVSRMGMKLEDYLKNIKKTEEDLKKDWRPDALKHTKLQLVLNTIAEKEKIEPLKEAVEHEVKHLLERHKEADPERARAYVANILANEKVFEFLEEQT